MAKHRPYRAREQHADRHDLRAALLGRFANDEKFRRRLVTLPRALASLRCDLAPLLSATWPDLLDEAKWEDAPPIVVPYIVRVRAFAFECGLGGPPEDLESPPDDPECLPEEWGAVAIHDWLTHRLADPAYPPADFGLWLYPVRIAPDPPPGTVLTREGRVIPIHVMINATWRFRSESPAVAKKQAYAYAQRLINAEIDQRAGQMEQVGYTFREDTPALDKHLNWLFARVFHRRSCFDIALEVSETRDMTDSGVRKPTDRLAAQIGITIPDPLSDSKRM